MYYLLLGKALPKFHAYLIQRGNSICHPHHKLGMPVPLYDLGGYLHKTQAQVFHCPPLYLDTIRAEGRLGTHSTRHLAHCGPGLQFVPLKALRNGL